MTFCRKLVSDALTILSRNFSVSTAAATKANRELPPVAERRDANRAAALGSLIPEPGLYPLKSLICTCSVAFALSTAEGQLTTSNVVNFQVFGAGAAQKMADPTGMSVGVDGRTYGTFESFGSNNFGGIYVITPPSSLIQLFGFNSNNGAYPMGGLVQGVDGALYGTTSGGGARGYGTVFKVTTNGALVWSVSFNGTNGELETQGLSGGQMIGGRDGFLYGVTYYGGTKLDNFHQRLFGTVYKMNPTNGNFVWSFTFNGTNGCYAYSLTQAADGNLYGATATGGRGYGGQAGDGYGTVFRITTDGALTPLFLFANTNGARPHSVTQGTDGDLYGTTDSDSSFNSTAFRMTTNGVLVWSVPIGGGFDVYPTGLAQAADGNFYGESNDGGGHGSLFRISTSGAFSNLLFFSASDGFPAAPMVAVSPTLLLASTGSGGPGGGGTIFALLVSAPASPPVFQPPFLTNGMIELNWTATPAQQYQLLWKSNLTDSAWQNLGSPISATGNTATAFDFLTNAQRFYRLMVH
jgi:uncharacterized repeat protein (TIGR03803 family)